MDAFSNFPRHIILPPVHAETPPASPPVYSCKKNAEDLSKFDAMSGWLRGHGDQFIGIRSGCYYKIRMANQIEHGHMAACAH